MGQMHSNENQQLCPCIKCEIQQSMWRKLDDWTNTLLFINARIYEVIEPVSSMLEKQSRRRSWVLGSSLLFTDLQCVIYVYQMSGEVMGKGGRRQSPSIRRLIYYLNSSLCQQLHWRKWHEITNMNFNSNNFSEANLFMSKRNIHTFS